MTRHGEPKPVTLDDFLLAVMADCDPDLLLVTGPLAPDNCGCEALCDCDNSTTVEASAEPGTQNPY